jgi:hypothetical protein
MDILRVFLSSTSRDLKEHRDSCFRAIQKLEGFHCLRMDDFGARPIDPAALCAAKVAECDLFVAIIGHLHGSCPAGRLQSYTELEYEAARAQGKPCLVFLAIEDALFPVNLIESDAKRQRQRAFRKRIAPNHVRDTFRSPDDLAQKLTQAIHNWWRDRRHRPTRLAHASPRSRHVGVRSRQSISASVFFLARLDGCVVRLPRARRIVTPPRRRRPVLALVEASRDPVLFS